MNEKMNAKNYSTWDRAFMLFGSCMNAHQGKEPDKEKIEAIWAWCRKSSKEWTEANYNDHVKPL